MNLTTKLLMTAIIRYSSHKRTYHTIARFSGLTPQDVVLGLINTRLALDRRRAAAYIKARGW